MIYIITDVDLHPEKLVYIEILNESFINYGHHQRIVHLYKDEYKPLIEEASGVCYYDEMTF